MALHTTAPTRARKGELSKEEAMATSGDPSNTLTVTSEQFSDGNDIPISAAYTSVGGDNKSPQLSWTEGPAGTKSYAITCWDPDAPTTVGFSHWLRFDIPVERTALDEGAGTGAQLGSDGFTDFGESAYGGMAPPAGDSAHHYYFIVYALDIETTGLDDHTTYAKFRFATKDHIVAQGQLVGLFAVAPD
jgi:Raf kinase inhibitor-like YbhB/YbcL family protein